MSKLGEREIGEVVWGGVVVVLFPNLTSKSIISYRTKKETLRFPSAHVTHYDRNVVAIKITHCSQCL